MKKIYAYLNGGLGNQMFQYATARALALRTNAELVLDSWSGFARDYQYRRHYELDGLPVQARVATALERLPIWLYRADTKCRGQKSDVIQRRLYGTFIIEKELRYLDEINNRDFNSSAWLLGYWQSPLYFKDHADFLRGELMPPSPTQVRFLELGKILREKESVALGIRLYEESLTPANHARGGQMKTVAEVNSAIERLRSKHASAEFFVFCTHRSPLLAELNLPEDAILVTHDDGYEGSLERLWLLAQCKHHIFTNSSYYWWGAWLSFANYTHDSGAQHILAADNFINQDGLCEEWETF
jgi:hypothetical protein